MKHEADGELKAQRKHLAKLQEVLYAGGTDGLLIVLQGMDTSGKDGTIRGIFDGVNPQGCNVASFKVPTPVELKHDFLWRVHPFAPARGMIGIFNRSHYEDVLAPVVHGTIDRKTATQRMKSICDFESLLSHSGITVLKFFLHISSGGAGQAPPVPHRRQGQALEAFRRRFRRAQVLDQVPGGLRRHLRRHKHRRSTVVHHPRRPQMASQRRNFHCDSQRAQGLKTQVPEVRPRRQYPTCLRFKGTPTA